MSRKPTPVPSPPELLLKERDVDEVIALVEKHIRLMRTNKDGSQREVALQAPFARGLMKPEFKSRMAICRGASRMPMVIVKGSGGSELFWTKGLHRKRQILFRVPEEVMAILPRKEDCTMEAGKAAWKFLTEQWLVDVMTDANGKAILIAMALTILQRHMLMERPGFIARAGQRGSGKTTALNMVAVAANAHRASASPWSLSSEERKKMLFAVFREGVSLVVFDNIARGTTISDPSIEAALTTGNYKDRVLGVSESETVMASTVLAWTGNRIAPRGDLASRVLIVEMSSDRPDPENRPVENEDPIRWTTMHRGDILRALYTILLLPRPSVASRPTRFKKWWWQIGYPIEQISGVSFKAMFDSNEEEDEEASSTAEFLSVMHEKFGFDKFTSAQVAKLLDPDLKSSTYYLSQADKEENERAKTLAAMLRGNIEEAAGKAFPPGPPNAHKVGKKLQIITGRVVLVDGLGVVKLSRKEVNQANFWRVTQI